MLLIMFTSIIYKMYLLLRGGFQFMYNIETGS